MDVLCSLRIRRNKITDEIILDILDVNISHMPHDAAKRKTKKNPPKCSFHKKERKRRSPTVGWVLYNNVFSYFPQSPFEIWALSIHTDVGTRDLSKI